MEQKQKLPVTVSIFLGSNDIGLKRKQDLMNEAKRKGTNVSRLVLNLIIKYLDVK